MFDFGNIRERIYTASKEAIEDNFPGLDFSGREWNLNSAVPKDMILFVVTDVGYSAGGAIMTVMVDFLITGSWEEAIDRSVRLGQVVNSIKGNGVKYGEYLESMETVQSTDSTGVWAVKTAYTLGVLPKA